MEKIYISGLREITTKSGKNAGAKSIFFTVTFRTGESLVATTGWRLVQSRLLPIHTRYGSFGKILNLAAVDSQTAREIYYAFKDALSKSEFAGTHELLEDIENAISLIVLRKDDLIKFTNKDLS